MSGQLIRPEVWQEGIDDNRLLPGRYTTGMFTGKGVNIANNNDACLVYDMQVTDYITDYDDRRINGLIGPGSNTHGHDGWAASAYGVFQDVRWDYKLYTMGRHRSVAMRIFEEMQYAGDIGYWGDATNSSVVTNGEALMKKAQILSKAKDLWQKEVLGPDIDKYNLFAVLNGHMAGRWVQDNPDQIFSDEGTWVAQPGRVQGEAIPPRFAPIHAIEWDDNNIPLLLHNLAVTWTNLYIPEDNRVIYIDQFYKYRLMMALTGQGIPATEAAYSDLQNGTFTRLMGWDFNFDIPSQYWPRLWLDDNMNVVHSENGDAAYDQLMLSTDHTADGDRKLMLELVDSDRMTRANYVRTVWDKTAGKFRKILTNYPLGMPATIEYLGLPVEIANPLDNIGTGYPDLAAVYPTLTAADTQLIDTYGAKIGQTIAGQGSATINSDQWTVPGAGFGLPYGTQVYGEDGTTVVGTVGGPVLNKTGKAAHRQVIGLALYRPAAQLSQEYSSMQTAEGLTRGKFTEMVFDVKYDAWVIEGLSHGIIPIVDSEENRGTFALPVKIVANETTTGGTTEGGNTEGGNTEGGNTEGGNTEGGNTEGGNTVTP